MRKKNKPTKEKVASKKSAVIDQAHETETMSQIQNRYKGGREKNGSDGTSNSGRGSNH